MDDLSVTPTRQGQPACERFARIGAFTRIAFTIGPRHIITITVVRAISGAVRIVPLVVALLDPMRA